MQNIVVFSSGRVKGKINEMLEIPEDLEEIRWYAFFFLHKLNRSGDDYSRLTPLPRFIFFIFCKKNHIRLQQQQCSNIIMMQTIFLWQKWVQVCARPEIRFCILATAWPGVGNATWM
jgi:hypothetical protein